MVRVEDVTKEEIEAKDKFNRARSLVEEIFGDSFKIKSNINGKHINIYENGDEIATFYLDWDLLKIYNEKYETVFEKFGEIYEKMFKIKNLNMRLDYS